MSGTSRPSSPADTDRSRIALINIGMGMVVAMMAAVLVSCGTSEEDSEDTGQVESTGGQSEAAPDAPDAPDAAAKSGEAMSREEIQVTARDRGPMVMAERSLARPDPAPAPRARPSERDRFPEADANPVKSTAEEPVSTFSIDVDTASYGLVRRYLSEGRLPPGDAVRIEELINYFDYAYPVPQAAESPFTPALEVMPSPWAADTRILRIGLKGYDLQPEEAPDLNLVLLLDVSGSMSQPDKLPLLKKAMALLVETLGPEDRVGIVVYAGASGVVLEPTPGTEKTAILTALNALDAGGSTAGGEGIELAYALARRHFDAGRVNRVILATDGDFNVGITDPRQLEDYVARQRDSGIYLTVLGFGLGNLNDALMQRLAQTGNGQAAYIDTLREARKVLVDKARATLFPIAKDVKIQVEFNPARVAEYRLIGYETRLLEQADFNNDRVDAGEIGSGHTVTALYESTPQGSEDRLIDPNRYGGEEASETPPAEEPGDLSSDLSGEWAFVRLRYKLPDEDESRLIEAPVGRDTEVDTFDAASQDSRFAVSVAAFAQTLRNDPYGRDLSLEDILAMAVAAKGQDTDGARAEFTELVRAAMAARTLEGTAPQP